MPRIDRSLRACQHGVHSSRLLFFSLQFGNSILSMYVVVEIKTLYIDVGLP
ncbi:hypothetical protein RchiOBHm_Chr2g0128371 [Rosa chinensis]|uniref:Uncharacterized protein n=1 Tax=Rosa chinensis TaxID=74649 RepID=A0A2P6RUA7_ROSCH|nr:hypothetical protein RchiOBHm_Chr2g0128371 [Rosa chinensis]